MATGTAHNPSYGWRSIIAARSVLQEGLRKKIGNGHDTMVWEEPWLPVNPARPPRQRNNQLDMDLRVHHLIDFESQTWNIERLNEFFRPEEVPRILELRISRTGRSDCYSWDFTKSGLYSVRSGYEVAHRLRTKAIHPVVLEPSTTALKKATWKLKAPRKLKHFQWQAISGFLATAEQLKTRHCAQDSTCVRCGAEVESINHTLFECPSALQCWTLSSIPTSPGIFPCNSIYANFDYLLFRAKAQGVESQLMEPFPWIMWYIWKARNEKILNDKDINPLDSMQVAMKEAESWRTAQCVAEVLAIEGEVQPMETHQVRQTSDPGRWRCTIDASWTGQRDAAGLGFILIDGERPILYGARGNIKAATPLHAEAEGLIWAMQELSTRRRRKVHFQSDCEQLVKLIRTEMEWPALAPELDEIKALAHEFRNFSVSYISRTMNVRADSLAKGGRVRVSDPFVDVFAPTWLAPEASLTAAE